MSLLWFKLFSANNNLIYISPPIKFFNEERNHVYPRLVNDNDETTTGGLHFYF